MAIWSPNVEEILTDAYERCGVDAETISDYQIDQGMRSLNFLLAEWSTRKTLTWRIEQWKTNSGDLPEANAGLDEDGFIQLPDNTIDILTLAIRYPDSQPSGSDIWLRRLSYEDYTRLPNKQDGGFPYQYLFHRTRPPKVRFWRPADRAYEVYAWLKVAVGEVDNFLADDTVPYRFLEALVSGLSCKLATKIAPERLPMLDQQAMTAWMSAADEDDDGVGLQFIPARFM